LDQLAVVDRSRSDDICHTLVQLITIKLLENTRRNGRLQSCT
jgi:hypothetical protein